MDRERLTQLIIEEIVRALAEQGVTDLRPGSSLSAAPRAVATAPIDEAVKPGVVVFSGTRAADPRALDVLADLSPLGYRAEALASFSFRQTQSAQISAGLKGLTVIANPDDEAAMEQKIAASKWIVAVDASLNTLNKVLLGLEDSAPSRAVAQALRLGLGCVFLESAPAPLRGPESQRAGLIRRIESRGAVMALPENLAAVLHQATLPPDEKLFKPPAPRPEIRHRIITREDVYEAAARGQTEFTVPAGAIITSEAVEDAARRGLAIRRGDE